MRNSAWYHKLWRKKFDSLQIKDSADASWTSLHKLLDEQMPVSPIKGNGPKISGGSKPFKIFGYALPVVVTVSTIVYFTVFQSKDKQIVTKLERKEKMQSDSIFKDSSIVQNNRVDAVRGDSVASINSSLKEGEQDKAISIEKSVNNIESINPSLTSIKKERDTLDLKTKNDVNAREIKSKYDPPTKDIIYAKQNIDGSTVRTLNPVLQANRFLQERISLEQLISSFNTVVNQNAVSQGYMALNAQSDLSSTKKQNKANAIIAENNKKGKDLSLLKSKKSKIKVQKEEVIPTYSYGIAAGLNLFKNNSNIYAGLSGTYSLNKKWILSIALNVNGYEKIAEEIAHPSYYRPDSLPPFIIADTRKVMNADIPLTVGYRISKHVTVKAGPSISFPISESDALTRLNPISDRRDTLFHSKEINTALSNTVSNKMKVGFTGGISIHIRQFDINSSYQWMSPYKISNNLGSYKQTNGFFRIGLGYRFK